MSKTLLCQPFVVNPHRQLLMVYDQEGNLLDARTGLSMPTGVACILMPEINVNHREFCRLLLLGRGTREVLEEEARQKAHAEGRTNDGPHGHGALPSEWLHHEDKGERS